MKRLFNIFKKKKEETIAKPKPVIISVNDRSYIIEDSSFIKVQSRADDIQVYGYSIESRYKMNSGECANWYTYNNKIYSSYLIAMDAAVKIGDYPGYKDNHGLRVIPLYKMNEPQYRDYKLDRILGKRYNKKEYEVKGWKLKEDYEYYKYQGISHIWKKGSVLIQLENGDVVKSGTSLDTTVRYGFMRDKLISDLIPKGLVEEIEIKDEKWLHPHLLKELKVKLKINQK